MPGTDIIVVGTIDRAPNGSRTLRGTRAVVREQWEAEQNQVSTNPDSGLIGEEIVVTAKVVNEANRQRVYRAAALVIKGIARLRDRLDRATGTTIQIGNRTYTMAELVEDLNNTEWTVGDGKPVGVPGISNVTRDTTGGKHTVFVNMDGIIGAPSNNDAGGYDGWPNDDLGLTMYVLHELAHLSEVGWRFNVDSGQKMGSSANRGAWPQVRRVGPGPQQREVRVGLRL